MSEQYSKYGKGMVIKKRDFTNKKTGEDFIVYSLGINKTEFLKNPFNENGWANFEIRFAQGSGKPYIVKDTYTNNIMSTVKAEDTKNPQAIADNDANEEIPF